MQEKGKINPELKALLFVISGFVFTIIIMVSIRSNSQKDYAGTTMRENDLTGITSATKVVTRKAMFYEKMGNKVRCDLCFRRCMIDDGKRGFCRVRENIKGELYTLVHSLPSAVHIDPVEKEPMYHFLPSSEILCLGSVGCNFKCKHCHNWHLSQSSPGDLNVYHLPPESVIDLAVKNKIPTISFTYNDPIVLYEYVLDVAKLARENSIKTIIHTNAAINPEPLKELLKYIDGITVDLKSVYPDTMRTLSEAHSQPTLDSLKIIKDSGVWLEIVNLVITGINDSEKHIEDLCDWVVDNLGVDVPIHFTRFFPNYKYRTVSPTSVAKLEKAYEIAVSRGIMYVYLGNVPGHKYNSTYCPNCDKRLIQRSHFQVISNDIKDGKCKHCGHEMKGVW